MNINYLQIIIGILIGIVLCIQFPNLPNQLKQIAKNFKKAQEKEEKKGCAKWFWDKELGCMTQCSEKNLCPECSK